MRFLSCVLILAVFALSNAKRCGVPCTREYRPVCGSNGEHYKIFPNMCMLKNAYCNDGQNWFQARMDECKPESKLEEEERCEVPCTREFRPVCGTDGEHFTAFPNPCVLRNQHCKDGQNWFQTDMFSCGNQNQEELTLTNDCPKMCPALYAPVCGSDGQSYKIFSNKCMMKAENCRLHKNWFQTRLESCTNSDEEDCPNFCPALYAPVCGFDGQVYKLFSNKCIMNAANCRDHKSWSFSDLNNCTHL